MDLKQIDEGWFSKDTPFIVKIILLTFVWGDALVMFPLFLVLIILALINIHWGILGYLIVLFLRMIFETVYWLFQQFGEKTYRPYDFGFKKISNNSVYILYQLLTMSVASIVLIILIIYAK